MDAAQYLHIDGAALGRLDPPARDAVLARVPPTLSTMFAAHRRAYARRVIKAHHGTDTAATALGVPATTLTTAANTTPRTTDAVYASIDDLNAHADDIRNGRIGTPDITRFVSVDFTAIERAHPRPADYWHASKTLRDNAMTAARYFREKHAHDIHQATGSRQATARTLGIKTAQAGKLIRAYQTRNE